MPVRGCDLTGQDHLIGADQRASSFEIGAGRRITQHQVAALGKRNVDQPSCGVEPSLGVVIGPVRRTELRPRLAPQDRRLTRDPAGREVERAGGLVERVERWDIAVGKARCGDRCSYS